jgi:large subunit ribosomal protein L9
MQVILTQDVSNLGAAGELVSVRDGYGRNFLLPRKLAVLATAKNVSRIEHEKRSIAARTAKEWKTAQEFAGKLEGTTVNVARQSGDGDKLFGSVTARDVGEALTAAGYPVDHRKIDLAEPIKSLGLHEVVVKLGNGIQATIKVWVVKQ